MVRRAFQLALVFLILAPAAAFAQAVTATADRTSMAVGEELHVEVEYIGGGRAQLSEPAGDDFVILGTSTMSSMQIMNGRRASRLTFTVTMRPSRTGQLTVGRFPVSVGGQTHLTEPIAISVTETSPEAGADAAGGVPVRPIRPTAPTGNSGPASRQAMAAPMSDLMFRPTVRAPGRDEPFIIATITEASPTVGQQFVIDFVLMRPDSVFFGLDSLEMTEPDFASLWFEEITELRSRGRFNRLGTVRVGGGRYTPTVIRSYAAFALSSGELVIPSMEFVVADRGMRSRGRRTTLRSQPLVLDVQPPPADGASTGFHPGNIGVFELQATTDVRVARAGDTVNVTISVLGGGLVSRLDLPSLPEFEGARVYPADDTHTQAVGPDGWMRGTARRRISVVPLAEGSLQLPEVTFEFYDPWLGEYVMQTVALPEIPISGQNPNVETVAEPITGVRDDWIEELPPRRPVRSSAPAPAVVGVPYWIALAVPPFAFSLLVWFGAVRRRRRASAGSRARDFASAKALTAIDGSAPGDVAVSMRAYLEDLTGGSARGLRYDAVTSLVSGLTDEATGRAFASALEAVETARFSGAVDPGSLAADAVAAIERLEERR